MNYWLIKSEPSVYSWEKFVKEKKAQWDGVRNYAARLHLRAMKKGDPVLFYHSNEGTEIVGMARVSREAYPDPTTDADWSAVDFIPVKKFKIPVTLTQVKANKNLSEMALIRISRLSVQPVSEAEWKIIMEMGGV